jgi:hypothetical protein
MRAIRPESRSVGDFSRPGTSIYRLCCLRFEVKTFTLHIFD